MSDIECIARVSTFGALQAAIAQFDIEFGYAFRGQSRPTAIWPLVPADLAS